MRMTINVIVTIMFLTIACSTSSTFGYNDSLPADVVEISVIHDSGGRVSWCEENKFIAVDLPGGDGYYDLYRMRRDGSKLKNLTAGKAGKLPQLNIGQPAWHPSGDFIVFQAQDPALGFPPGYTPSLKRWVTSPGIGVNNNLWITTLDGRKFWQLTNVKTWRGVLHPQFSPDGKKLIWSEKVDNEYDGSIGHWVIKLANFSVKNNKPRLKKIQILKQPDLQLCETHGFSPDGKKLIFSGIKNGKSYFEFEIYVLDMKTMDRTRLTNNDEWDEHAHFSPDGEWIVYSSSEGIPQNKVITELRDLRKIKLDYWIMKADGSGKQRITYFNEPSHSHYMIGRTLAADFDWGSENNTIIAYIKRPLAGLNNADFIARIEIDTESLD